MSTVLAPNSKRKTSAAPDANCVKKKNAYSANARGISKGHRSERHKQRTRSIADRAAIVAMRLQVFVEKRIVGDCTRALANSFQMVLCKNGFLQHVHARKKTLRILFILNLTSVRIECVDVTLQPAGAILARGFGVSSSTVV
ncbi:hypothetical protein OKW45_002481 [Paraburkholderia sp. WSM4175]|uniref:hypothetical protein n=1 Tax=Paraburkholderia sp. WSM4175 TaxID=2991072 RepID=UPI003D1CA688